MKVILSLSLLILLSCEQPKVEYIGQEIVDGKISDKEESYLAFDWVYVQTNKNTKKVEIPKEIGNRFKVGDSCLLIIEKYKEYETRK